MGIYPLSNPSRRFCSRGGECWRSSTPAASGTGRCQKRRRRVRCVILPMLAKADEVIFLHIFTLSNGKHYEKNSKKNQGLGSSSSPKGSPVDVIIRVAR